MAGRLKLLEVLPSDMHRISANRKKKKIFWEQIDDVISQHFIISNIWLVYNIPYLKLDYKIFYVKYCINDELHFLSIKTSRTR